MVRRTRERPRRAATAGIAVASALAITACQTDAGPEVHVTGPGGSAVETIGEGTAADDASTLEETGADHAAPIPPGVEESHAYGTRNRPLPVGTPVQVGDWSVTVESVISNANQVVAAENQFNEDPPEGRQFVLWRVTVTYLGTGSVMPGSGLSWSVVGSQGNSYVPGSSPPDGCGTIPEPMSRHGQIANGSTRTGNLCSSVVSEQVDGATISIAATSDDERVFVEVP